MLKITSEKDRNSVRLRLEGSLTGPWVGELEHEWQTIQPAEAISPVVDLTNVTFVGEDGHLAKEITRSRPNGSSVRYGTQ